MKKTSLTILLSAFLCQAFLLTHNANAGASLTTNVITKVAFHTGGFFIYGNAWNNPNSCISTAAVVLLSTDPNYDKAYALLLSAYVSGKTVTGFSDGCTTMDGVTYNTIRGFKYLVVN